MIPSVLSLVFFCFAMAATPGPNNMMVMASAARYGTRRTLPHVFGITLGFPAMLGLVGGGVGTLLLASPPVHHVLEILGILFMLWIAWRVAIAGAPHEVRERATRPLSFLEAALFQWVNPKAWAIAISAIALYTRDAARLGGALWIDVALIAVIFALICLPTLLAWAALGRGAGTLLRTERQFRLFNRAMAALLVLALLPLAWHG